MKFLNKGERKENKKEENTGIPWGRKNLRTLEETVFTFPY